LLEVPVVVRRDEHESGLAVILHLFREWRHEHDSTRHFAVISTEARVVSQSIPRVQPLPDLS
jgi:hypothetical protein